MAVQAWLSSALTQHFPNTPVRRASALNLEGALNERLSFQVAVRAGAAHEKIAVEVLAPNGWQTRVRRVGYVPLWHRNGIHNPEGDGHLPGLCPDPLFDETECLVSRNETQAFYLTLVPGVESAPGPYTVEVRICPEQGRPLVRKATVFLHDLHLLPRRDFHVTNWFTADSVFDWYGCKGFDERFWGIVPAYFRNMAEHGQNMLSSPLLNWSTRRPTQLLRVRRDADTYTFDFSLVKRWVDLARAAGIECFEWMDLFTWWNAGFTARVYEGDPEERRQIWRTQADPTTPHYKKYSRQIGKVDTPDATGPESRNFFSQLLPAVERFLKTENLLDKSWFHIGDEPEAENYHNYRKTRTLLHELAPWLRVTDPFNHLEYSEPGLIELPFPRTRMVPEIVGRGQETAAYYCGNPGAKSINRLMDTPLAQVRMNGWTFYRFGIRGFLHWAYNFWYRLGDGGFAPADPFANFDTFKWPHNAYGDCWSVYPGPDGPIDTLRWEAFADSLQDYRMLQTLELPRQHRSLQDIVGFSDFPIDENWVWRTRRNLFESVSVPAGPAIQTQVRREPN